MKNRFPVLDKEWRSILTYFPNKKVEIVLNQLLDKRKRAMANIRTIRELYVKINKTEQKYLCRWLPSPSPSLFPLSVVKSIKLMCPQSCLRVQVAKEPQANSKKGRSKKFFHLLLVKLWTRPEKCAWGLLWQVYIYFFGFIKMLS